MGVAAALFREMKVKGYTPDSVTYATLAKGYVASRKIEVASELFRHMVRSRVEPVVPVYRIIARELCNGGKVGQAVALWVFYVAGKGSDEEAAAVAQSVEQERVGKTVQWLLGLGGGRLPYGRWVAGLCRARQEEEAFTVFLALCEHGVALGVLTCAQLIQSFCWAGKMKWALRVMEYSLEKGVTFQRPVGNRVLKFLWDRDVKEALKLAGRMARTGYVLEVYLRKPMKQNLQSYGLCSDAGR